MIATYVHKGTTLKTVTVGGVTPADTDADIIEVSMEFAGESSATIADVPRVARYTLTPDRVNVYIYTD